MSAEANTILVLRSTGQKEKLPFPLNQSLKELKRLVSESTTLGNIPIESQRVFHLGRELKTNGRSLESLGVGRMGITVLHVHSAPLKKRAAPKKNPPPIAKPPAAATNVIDLADDSDSDDDCVIVDEVATSGAKFSKRQRVG